MKNDSGALSYVFQYKDHLGNVRVSYAKNPQTQVLEIIEENNYYPFGLKHKGYNDYLPIANKYKLNNKELQDELSLNLYDFGMRNYDPALGRWMNIDPLAEFSRRWTPYTYCYNNPMFFVDPDGMQAVYNWEEHDKGNKGVYNDGDKTVSFEDVMHSVGRNANSNDSIDSDSNVRGSDEEPVSLFTPGNNRFDGVVKSRNYKKGDRSFTVYGHGAVQFMFDELGRFTVRNAEDFDKMMSALNDQWDEGKGKKGTTLSLWTCESARIGKNGLSLAQMISEAYPNITVIGADGYVNYREIDKNTGPCEYKISGVSKVMYSGKNDGDLVAYKNGVEVSRKKF
ncbi:RHS repeat domain-containing protein [Flavobacterium aquidurense]|uniref:RHS repeat domain-containing protein n=1 Tax=Flavobacterium aquidurense TaxID=362413 RepID=UPI0037209880